MRPSKHMALICVGVLAAAVSGCDKISEYKDRIFSKPSPEQRVSLPAAPDSSSSPETGSSAPAPSSAVTAPVSSDFVAKVGDWTLTRDGFNERLTAVKEFVPEFNVDDPQSRRLVLDEIVRQQLMVADAERQGLAQKKNVVDAVEEFRRTLLVREIAVNLTQNIQVSDQEAEEYYKANQADFAGPVEWRFREIVVNDEDAAKSILVDILKGADFVQTATEKSKSMTAAKGGDAGFVAELPFPQMEKELVSLEVGQASKVFKGPDGFYIVKLEEKRGEVPREFSEIKEEIRAGLTLVKQQQAIMEYLETLRQKTVVEINEKALEE
ncbi:MAG: peptidyl-prolyl cis-trans isomerase [Candidatus Omnitrophota bacterium]|nr:peptidyl-prolyl cis-trans isomerase [Candidatus Omnitrophota bacterium]MDZ4241209.1 peptidyl-prolyl cis-trans isomerase [Candidatus Omnitrophota bacterium]